MFMTKGGLKLVIKELLGEREGELSLKKDIKKLEEEKARLQLDKKMEIEEIKHLSKLAEAKRDVELDQHKVKMERDYAEKARISLEGFHSKMEVRFNEELKNFKEIYGEIIKRLPNVNMEIKEKR